MTYRKNSITGKFRAALEASGFAATTSIFSDKSKSTGVRRLKLWGADHIFTATQAQQDLLEQHLRTAYGDNFLSMYFIKQSAYWDKNLCVKLKA